MKKLLHILARLKRLKWREIGRLVLLCATACIVAATMMELDISVTALLLDQQGISGIGFNYLIAAMGLLLAGIIALRLERRRGYGAAGASALILCLWIALQFWIAQTSDTIPLNLMFSLKYGTFFLIHVAFWSLAERYIKLSIHSLKFLGIFCFECLGTGLGAWVIRLQSPIESLKIAIFCLFICSVLFKILGWLESVPKETFVRKLGGVQDAAEKVIVGAIFAISFCWTFLHALIEFQVYALIVEIELNPVNTLSMIYIIYACCVIFATPVLAPRFWQTIQLGLILCALSCGLCALGGLISSAECLYAGTISFFVLTHLYQQRYLSLLPCPLALGQGIRLKKVRWLVIRPCAFILLGSVLLTLPTTILNWILIAAMCLLGTLFIMSGHLYGRQLVKMCALRMWHEGPFVLTYPPLKQMIHQGLSKPNAAEVIYFLNILGAGDTKDYRISLFKTLAHPSVSVRLFALHKMMKIGLTLKEKRQISEVMKKDSSKEVKNMALALLITDALEGQRAQAWQKYKAYLDDPKWIWGACIGFLSGKGAWLDKVVAKVLTFAHSTKEKDNLIALSIMQAHPRTDWTDAVNHLLNKQNPTITKAALTAAGKLGAPILLTRLLPMLDEIRWRDQVLETLHQYGKQAFPAIEKMILSENAPMDRQRELILFLGRLPSGEGKQILLRTLFQSNRLLHSTIIESLSDSEIVWVHKDRKRILKKSIHSSVQDWHEMNDMLFQTENLQSPRLTKIKPLFQEAFREELHRTRQLILDQIALYFNIPLAKQAVQTLKDNDLNAYAGAVSCLQDLLGKKLYATTREILLYPTLNTPPSIIQEMPVDVFLSHLILNPFHWTTPWLQALTLYSYQALGKSSGLTAVKVGLKAKDWVVLEAALSALGTLEKDKKKAEDMALAVPTRYLLQQNFEKLLEEKDADYH